LDQILEIFDLIYEIRNLERISPGQWDKSGFGPAAWAKNCAGRTGDRRGDWTGDLWAAWPVGVVGRAACCGRLGSLRRHPAAGAMARRRLPATGGGGSRRKGTPSAARWRGLDQSGEVARGDGEARGPAVLRLVDGGERPARRLGGASTRQQCDEAWRRPARRTPTRGGDGSA
jgi:hypothetical protein